MHRPRGSTLDHFEFNDPGTGTLLHSEEYHSTNSGIKKILRAAVNSLALGLVMCGYFSMLVPSRHWRWSTEAVLKEKADRPESLKSASGRGDIAEMKRLLGGDVDVNSEDKLGVTPLIAAAAGLQHEAVALLLSHGADPSRVTKEGFSAYDFAHNQNDEVLMRLLAKGR